MTKEWGAPWGQLARGKGQMTNDERFGSWRLPLVREEDATAATMPNVLSRTERKFGIRPYGLGIHSSFVIRHSSFVIRHSSFTN